MTAKVAFRTLTATAVGRNLNTLIAVAADVLGEYGAAEIFFAGGLDKLRLSFGVWLDDRLIGYAILSRPGPEHIHLHHLMIAAEERNVGYGTHMVAEMAARCRVAGVDKLTLKTPQDNVDAIRFYGRFNFAKIRVERGYILMTKTL